MPADAGVRSSVAVGSVALRAHYGRSVRVGLKALAAIAAAFLLIAGGVFISSAGREATALASFASPPSHSMTVPTGHT